MNEYRLSEVWDELSQLARSEGALAIGATTLDDAHAPLFAEWLAQGHGGSMSYLTRHLAVRQNPNERYPWARSVIAITVPYSPKRPSSGIAAQIARYAQGDDYHDVLDEILQTFERLLKSRFPGEKSWRYVDTGPLSDRSMAAQSGLGWIGRNSMLLSEHHGSYFFIGLLVTSLINDIETESAADRCGKCTRCVDACPTEAILPNRTVDSNRCISHATIEQRGALDDWMKERIGENLFGCDICQEVCPWNGRAPESHPRLAPRETYRATPITDLLRADQNTFSALFRKSAIKRARRAGMVRNAVIVSRDAAALDAVQASDDEGVADALAWRSKARGE